MNRLSVRAVVAPLALLAGVAAFVWVYSLSIPSSSEQAAQQAAARQDARLRHKLADEVVHGDLSFEEAGCLYRHAAWDKIRQVCDK